MEVCLDELEEPIMSRIHVHSTFQQDSCATFHVDFILDFMWIHVPLFSRIHVPAKSGSVSLVDRG